MIPLGCVTGRFQPVHCQHLDLVAVALAACRHVIVAVTNPDSGARHREATSAHRHKASANPFSYFERARLLGAAMSANGWTERVTIVPFDLTRPVHWLDYVPATACQYVRAFGDWERNKAKRLEAGGYPVTLLEGDASSRLAASDIRAMMRSGDAGWPRLVPPATVPLIEAMLAERPMDQRT